MGITRGPNIVTDGLVFAVDAANPSSYVSGSTIWKDQTVSQNNGTLTNGPTFDSGNGGSIDFDGGNDYVDCGDNTITKPSGPMTIEYWFKGQSSSANATGIGTTGNSGSRGYLLGFNNGSIIYFFIPSSSTSQKYITYNTTIDTNKWYCLTGVYNPSTYVRIYVNGVQVANSTSSIPSSLYTSNGISLKLGRRGDGIGFLGKISNFKLYHKVLSATEVLHNYNALKSRFE